MTLPDISAYIPKVVLPFDIPTLLHPITVHFMVAVPVIVLLLELINLFSKKKAIGVISFILLLITFVAATAAYFTGLVDGKEGFDLLSEAGKEELAEHKLLGTYLLLASVIVLLFKLLSAAMSSAIVKILYLLILVGFVLGIFEQGKDGGELVYEYGMNVDKVKTLDDKVFELEEALEEVQEKLTASKKETKAPVVTPEVLPVVVKENKPEATTPVETIGIEPQVVQEPVQEVQNDVKEVLPYTDPVEVEAMPKTVEQVQIPTH